MPDRLTIENANKVYDSEQGFAQTNNNRAEADAKHLATIFITDLYKLWHAFLSS